jgi:hypothetical protein
MRVLRQAKRNNAEKWGNTLICGMPQESYWSDVVYNQFTVSEENRDANISSVGIYHMGYKICCEFS